MIHGLTVPKENNIIGTLYLEADIYPCLFRDRLLTLSQHTSVGS